MLGTAQKEQLLAKHIRPAHPRWKRAALTAARRNRGSENKSASCSESPFSGIDKCKEKLKFAFYP